MLQLICFTAVFLVNKLFKYKVGILRQTVYLRYPRHDMQLNAAISPALGHNGSRLET